MPILAIQRRHAEHGRIRIGKRTPTSGGKMRPDKLDRFRFTSGDRAHIEALAQLYGGTASEWKNGTKTEWEVITDAKSIPVIAFRGSISQWMETWSGGGCIHRCDGQRNVLTDTPCDPEDRAHLAAKPTTRLTVMLRDLESLGAWRLETHGWNAAAELPAMAELAAFVGEYVPARLVLQQRTSVRDGKTSQFVVPVLDLAITKHRLNEVLEGSGTTAPAIGGGASGAPALEAAPTVDWAETLESATTTQECRAIWQHAGQAGQLTDELKAAISAKADALQQGQPEQLQQADTEDEPVEGEVMDEPAGDLDGLWSQIVRAAGERGWDLDQLDREYASATGEQSADMTWEKGAGFLRALQTGEAVPA